MIQNMSEEDQDGYEEAGDVDEDDHCWNVMKMMMAWRSSLSDNTFDVLEETSQH